LETLTRDALYQLIRSLQQQVAELTTRVQEAEARAEQAERRARQPRSKASTPPPEPRPRRPRAQGSARPREAATHTVTHAAESCPDCGQPLTGGWEHRRRQVIDLPAAPVTVTEHVFLARHCGVCGRRVLPRVTPAELGVIGQQRIGVRLTSLIAQLAIGGRMPVRLIQQHLATQHACSLSVGEITALLHTVAALGGPARDQLLATLRQSPVAHADETGWREAGQNGYLWLVRNADTCVVEYHRSRAGQVAVDLLGAEYAGVLVSDFYAAYNALACRHQRCWVHLLRDVQELALAHPDEAGVRRWARRVQALHRCARRRIRQPGYGSLPEAERIRWRQRFEQAALALATPYLQADLPQRVLAKRLRDYLTELFVFVEDPQVPADNNAAERAFRPIVIARKISGGTRSAKGSATKTTLLSLFATCRLRGVDPSEACLRLVLGQPMFQTA
jgi:transposase